MTTIRIADHDWLTAASDTPANTRFEGLIDASGITTIAQLGFWCWDGAAMQAGAAQVRLLDAEGLLDAAALGDLSGEAVALELATQDGTYAAAAPVARYVVDRLVVDSDGRKTLNLRDAHDLLDKTINNGAFASDVAGLAGQRMPMVIGSVFNAPVLLTGSDGSVGWLSDGPVNVGVLRDRGDPMEPGTWALDTYKQQVLLEYPPVGPMTADLTGLGGSSLDQCLRDVTARAGITAWSVTDAQAISTAAGSPPIGMYASQPVTARTAFALMLSTFGAWYWQDASGVLRLSRIADPDGMTPALVLEAIDLEGDVTYTTDTAPGLTTRMAYRANARPMRDTEFVTDFVDVPAELRAALSAPQGGVVTAAGAGTLPEEYRHALEAEPYPSLFADNVGAQTEISRVVALYQVVRRNWIVQTRADTPPLPGQCCLLTYPRHGLEGGRKLLVRRVEHNPATGQLKLTLWG